MARHLAISSLLLVAFTALAAAQVKPQRIRVSAGVESGLLQSKVDPVCPPLARQARIQGIVILKINVSKTGDVDHVELVSGHPLLAPAAIEAVKQWKYKPFLLNGYPLEVEIQVQVNFTLADNPPAQSAAANPPGTGPGEVPGGVPGTNVGGGMSGVIVSTAPNDAVGTVQRVRISSGVAAGLLLHKVNPIYPPDARDQRIQGTVVLKAIIDQQGNIAHIELISGHPLLAASAIEAVKQWQYRPYLLNQKPVEVETQIQVNFTLAN
ncbi:MAG: energy transducer TonB [Candidatus Sulfotelmatobacter sp.]